MLVDVGNAIASTVEEAFNAVAEKWNWLKSKIPFLGGDIEPSGYASPVDQSTAAPTTAKVLRVGAQNVAKKIKSAGDEKPVWDKAGGESFQSYQDKLSVWEAINKGKSVASAAQKYGVQQADGGMYYSETIAKQGQRGYEFMQNMGAPAAELALAKQQLAKQGGQPVVNQEIQIQVDGSKDPMFTSKIIRQEIERFAGAGIQSTPAGYN